MRTACSANRAEPPRVQCLTDTAGYRAELSRKTPTEEFRTARRPKLENMALTKEKYRKARPAESAYNAACNHSRPLHDVRHFVKTQLAEYEKKMEAVGLAINPGAYRSDSTRFKNKQTKKKKQLKNTLTGSLFY